MTEQIENFKINNSNWTKDIFKKCYVVYFSFASLQSLFYVPLTCTLGGWLPWTAPLRLPCHLISSWIVQKETLTVENRGPMKGKLRYPCPFYYPQCISLWSHICWTVILPWLQLSPGSENWITSICPPNPKSSNNCLLLLISGSLTLSCMFP